MIVLPESFFTEDRLNRDLRLLDEAIERWTGILNGDSEESETKCSLCTQYCSNPSSDKCGECPIALLTSRRHCFGTPYYDFGRLGEHGVAELFVPLLTEWKERWKKLFVRRRLEEEEVWSLFARVCRSLGDAEENGYSMELMGVDDITDDLIMYDVDFENRSVVEVSACVTRWKNGERLCP